MPSPIVSSTIQSAVLAASSCIIGQLITAHKSDELVPLLFLTFLPLSHTNRSAEVFRPGHHANLPIRSLFPPQLAAQFPLVFTPLTLHLTDSG
jgi:hypothetical protein